MTKSMFGEETPMIDLSTISSRSDLLDETLKGQLRQDETASDPESRG